MEFAIDLNRDDRAAAVEVLLSVTEWKRPEGRDYFVAPVTVKHPLLEGAKRAYFLKLAPGGMIHPHTDSASENFDTDLIVVDTNKRCRCFWQVDINTYSMRLEQGHRYRMAHRDIVHWAKNSGETDRIHLLIEYPK